MSFVTGGQAVVDTLLAHDVDTVFGIPGTHSLPLYEALARRPIRHVTPRSEQGLDMPPTGTRAAAAALGCAWSRAALA